jgi:hypothetical protein
VKRRAAGWLSGLLALGLCVPARPVLAAQLHVSVVSSTEQLRPECKAELQIPQARSMPGRPADRAFNEAMHRLVYDRLNSFRRHLAEVPAQQLKQEGSCEYAMGATVELQQGDRVSILFEEEFFSGEAHPAHFPHSVLYDFGRGRQLGINEVLRPGGLKAVSDICSAQLKRSLGVGGPNASTDADWVKRGAAPTATNYKSFFLTPKSLVIVFPEYQVAAYVAGEQRVEIPYSRLRRWLRPGF